MTSNTPAASDTSSAAIPSPQAAGRHRVDPRWTRSVWSRVCSWLLPVDEWAERFQYVRARCGRLPDDDRQFVETMARRMEHGLTLSEPQQRHLKALEYDLWASEQW